MSDNDHGGPGAADEDVGLPKATVNKLILELLPKDISCAKDSRDIITDACVEFIHLISSEANEVCEKDGKKMIAGEHVITALKNLGFEEYVQELTEVLEEHVKSTKERESRSQKLENSGLSMEELERMQEELLAKARRNLESGKLDVE